MLCVSGRIFGVPRALALHHHPRGLSIIHPRSWGLSVFSSEVDGQLHHRFDVAAPVRIHDLGRDLRFVHWRLHSDLLLFGHLRARNLREDSKPDETQVEQTGRYEPLSAKKIRIHPYHSIPAKCEDSMPARHPNPNTNTRMHPCISANTIARSRCSACIVSPHVISSSSKAPKLPLRMTKKALELGRSSGRGSRS